MIWKAIAGYEGYYEVSNTGLVRSLDRVIIDKNGVPHKRKGHLMRQTKTKGRDGNGYYVVNLRKNGETSVVCVHKIVAEAFIPNPQNLPTVNHKNGNKADNYDTNLEWASYGENNTHALKHGLRNPRGNKVARYTTDGVYIDEFKSGIFAARTLGISYGMISHCLNGRAATAGGFVWRKIFEGQTTIPEGSTPDDELPAEAQGGSETI